MGDNRKLEITYLIARFYPYMGGAEKYCYQLAKYAAQAGHKVTVLTTDASANGEELPKEEEIEGMHVVRMHRWNKQLNLGFYPSLLPLLLRSNADVIHVMNGPGFIWHEVCLILKRIFSFGRSKIIVTPHGPFLATPETHTGLKGYLTLPARIIMSPWLRFSWWLIFDKVLSVNKNQHKWMHRLYGISPSRVVDTKIGIERKLVLSEAPLKQENFVGITFLARFERYKGGDVLLKSLSKIKELPWRARMMGQPGAALPELKELAEKLDLTERVEFIISPSEEVKWDSLTSFSSIHVLPSQWEAGGIVLLEAMARGNTVITTKNNEMGEELIQNQENGYIVNYGNAEELARSIKLIIENSEMRSKMIANNLQKVQNYTWEDIAKKYLEFIESLPQHDK